MSMTVACTCILIVSALIFSSSAMPIEERNFNETIGKPLGGVYGVDVSQPTSQSAFSCLKNNGYSYAIVRAHYSDGECIVICEKTNKQTVHLRLPRGR